MLRCRTAGPSLWESILPPIALRMPPELQAVDRLLDDEAFFAPYREHFHAVLGRPSIPIECYLRMLFLKFRYRLSYETLCREVADSVSWSRFCRIGVGTPVPHPTTLMKITTRCGPQTIAALNEALLAKAHAQRLVRLDQVRADTTVVEANVAYPTDSGLLARGVARMIALAASLQRAGLASRTNIVDRTRSMRRRAHSIAAWLRRRTDQAKDEVSATTAEMARIAERTVAEARAVLVNARRGMRTAGRVVSGKTTAAAGELDRVAALVERIIAQTRMRLSGDIPAGSTRVVSLHDPDARPIAKGRLGRPVQFGYLAQIVDNADGLVLDHRVMMGNPPDAPLLAPAVERIKDRYGKAPRAVAADRGYGQAGVDTDLTGLGVKTVAIPRKGKPGAARQRVECARGFRRLVKWRTGIEGRISHLKHGYGMARTRIDGEPGAQIWCGLGILAHNTVKSVKLQRDRDEQRAARARGQPPDTQMLATTP